MAFCVVLVTVPDRECGEKTAEELVKTHLAACVNQIPSVSSTYWWQGKIQRDNEELLIIKTDKVKVKEIIKTVKKLHPYDTPEVISLPVKEGNRDYLKWIAESVGTKKAKPRKARQNKGKKKKGKK